MDARERVLPRNERRVDADGDRLAGCRDVRLSGETLADGEELDDIPRVAGGIDHRLVDRADAFAVDRIERDGRVEGERGQERSLLGGVVAVDIRRRVGLGEPECLRVGEDLIEVRAFPVDPVEDVVGRAIDDAHDPAARDHRRANRAAAG